MANYIFRKPGESVWYARLVVPVDVREEIGKREFKKSLDTTNKTVAKDRALAVVAEWKALIESIRRPVPVDIGIAATAESNIHYAASIADEIRTARGLSIPGIEQLIKDQEALLSEIIDNSGHPMPGLFFEELLKQPKQFKSVGNPFSNERLEKFRKYLPQHKNINEKTFDSHISRLTVMRDYLKKVGKSLNKDTIHTFLLEELNANSTRSQYLWSGKAFWKWAIRYDVSFKDHYESSGNPFIDQDLPSNTASKSTSYTPFTPEEITQLYREALKDKPILADLILFGAYTGCRLEEIGRLTVSDFTHKDGEIYSLKITESKTLSGIRELPIHPKLAPVAQRLINNSDNEGYLFPSGQNKYNNRLDYMSKQFGRLKDSLGFTKDHVFHSIRKTTATQLHHNGAREVTICTILGHKIGHITFDKYVDGTSIVQKMEAIKLLSFDL